MAVTDPVLTGHREARTITYGDRLERRIEGPGPAKRRADVNVRIFSDVALIHGRATYTMLADGAQQEALYTDAYQKRDGTWVCVAACAIAPGA
jgi:hypothetical protein